MRNSVPTNIDHAIDAIRNDIIGYEDSIKRWKSSASPSRSVAALQRIAEDIEQSHQRIAACEKQISVLEAISMEK